MWNQSFTEAQLQIGKPPHDKKNANIQVGHTWTIDALVCLQSVLQDCALMSVPSKSSCQYGKTKLKDTIKNEAMLQGKVDKPLAIS